MDQGRLNCHDVAFEVRQAPKIKTRGRRHGARQNYFQITEILVLLKEKITCSLHKEVWTHPFIFAAILLGFESYWAKSKRIHNLITA